MLHPFSLYILLYILTLCCCTSIVFTYHCFSKGKPKKISPQQKNLIAYNQQWKCFQCQRLMLSSFRLTNVKNCTYAVCIDCSNQFNLIDLPDKCLV